MIYKPRDHWHMDVMISGVRYREGLHTTDRREALRLEKKRVSEIQAGKGASRSGRDFARLPFRSAADRFVEERRLHVSERTSQLDRERLRPLRTFFGDTALLRLKASDITAYQRARLEGTLRLKANADASTGVSNRTVNMEITVLRQMMRRAKVWSVVAEDVRSLPARHAVVGRVLTAEQKKLLFCVAGTQAAWTVAHCAAVLAVSTTCRGVELKHLRWSDVDLFDRHINVRRSKTDAGQRRIPLNADGVAALAQLRHRADVIGATKAEHFVFPACENNRVDPLRPQKTWRTAWRSLVKATARQAGSEAAKAAIETGSDPGPASNQKASGRNQAQRDQGPRSRERVLDARDRDREPRDTFTRHLWLPSGPEREIVRDRDREYTLRGSESRTLATVGAFRVVSSRDLLDHNNRLADPRSGDLRHFREQGQIETVRVPGYRDHAVVLTKEGRSLLDHRQDPDHERHQTFHAGLVRPRELEHDVQIYRAYEQAEAGLLERGARIDRVVLDHELKSEYQRWLHERDGDHDDYDGHPDRTPDEIREWAQEHHLPYFDDEVHFPDARIEYEEPDGRWGREDIEVTTAHYRGAHGASVARTGFSRYRGVNLCASGRRGGSGNRPRGLAEELWL